MDPAKQNELNELRVKRAQVIAGLRDIFKRLQASREYKHPSDPLEHVETLLMALISLQETALLLDRWKEHA